MYAIDHFCDADLRKAVIAYDRFDELASLPIKIGEMCRRYSIDAVIPTSGAENLTGLPAPVLGSSPAVAARYLDKGYTQKWFESLQIPVPPLVRPGEFPAMLKALKGSGGWRNTIVHSDDDISAWKDLFPDEPFILQRIVDGIPASVCCVAAGGKARALAVNRQIMRGCGPYRFGFCGSVTPFDTPGKDEMIRYAELAAARSGCIGVLGIDFMVCSDAVYAIELNPRFVATLDTIESATGINLVDLHINACKGEVPESMPVPVQYAVRRILFADRSFTLTQDLSHLQPHVADVPVTPAEFEEGGAVISVFGSGSDLIHAEETLDNTIRLVNQYIQ